MKKILLLSLFLLTSLAAVAQLAPGSIAFTGSNGDGNDDLAFVTLDVIPANTTLYFSDSEWTGTSFPDADESRITWNSGPAAIPAGRVVAFSNINPEPATPILVTVGTATIRGNRGTAAGGDAIFAFLGTNDNTPTTFLAAISTNGPADFGTLTGTGLSVGTTAVSLTGGIAIGAYNGPRTGLSRACFLLAINDAVNWQSQVNGAGDQSIDSIAPDAPFSTTGLTFGSGCLQPVISFNAASRTESETAGSLMLTLNMTNAGSQPSSVEVIVSSGSAQSGQDYDFPNPLLVTFPAGATSQSFQVNIVDNTMPEADEYLTLRLQYPNNAVIGSGNQQVILIRDNDHPAPVSANPAFRLNLLTSYRNPTAGSSEIVAYEKTSRRLFIANSVGNRLNIVNFANPSAPVALSAIDMTPYGSINSVAVSGSVVAVALENANKVLLGKVAFFTTSGQLISQVTAGALPDMVGFSPDGRFVVTPNEGEPDSYSTGGTDPEGSITIIDVSGGVANLTQANVTTVGFTNFNSQRDALRAQGIRIFGRKGNVANGSNVAEDLEPEYVAFSPNSRFAYVTLQENNAIAVVDLISKQITELRPLGLKNHNLPGNAFDPTDQGTESLLQKQPVFGAYVPDAITSFTAMGQTYFITANEGDAREWDGLVEGVRLGEATYVLDPTAFPAANDLKNNLLLGRLNVTTADGDTDGDGDYDRIVTLGARSFSIWNAAGQLVWDSGDQLERITRALVPQLFNANNTAGNPAIKNRSDDKGPEPEGVITAVIGGRTYAFIALERIGGVIVYDVSVPTAPRFVTYANNRSIPANAATDDRGPEGIIYIEPADSPTGQALVLLANEVSNSVSVYGLSGQPLTILDPTFDCATGQLTVRTSGGDGSQIFYNAPSVFPYGTTNTGFLAAPVLRDRNQPVIPITVEQNGVTVTRNFNWVEFCQSRARIGAAEPTLPMQVSVLGNPAQNELTVDIRDAAGQEVTLSLIDAAGRVVSTHIIGQAADTERHTFDLRQQAPGVLTLQAKTARDVQVLRVVKR